MIPLTPGPELDRLIHCTLLGRTDKVRGYSSNPNAARYLQRKLMAMGRWTPPGGKLDCLRICEVALKSMAGVEIVDTYTSEHGVITVPRPHWVAAMPEASLQNAPVPLAAVLEPTPDPSETADKAPRRRTKRPDRAQAYNQWAKALKASQGIGDPKEVARLWRLEKAKPRSK